MQPLLMFALMLIVAILVIWLVIIVLNAVKLGEPWRTVIIVLLILGVVIFFARQWSVF